MQTLAGLWLLLLMRGIDNELQDGLRILNSMQHQGCQGAGFGSQKSCPAGCTGNGV